MKKVLIALVVVIIVVIVIALLLLRRGPDISQFAHLREPRISARPDQKVVQVEAKGDPNLVGREAIGLLFKTYYRIEGAPKWPMPAPRARWPVSLDAPKSEWIGLYALPVPGTTTELSEEKAEPGLKMSLTTWEYGDVVEILHVGPYSEEDPTVERLKDFIEAQGYEIIGEHEEEYVKGPGMFFKGNPEKYLTIIRYRVGKMEEAPASTATE